MIKTFNCRVCFSLQTRWEVKWNPCRSGMDGEKSDHHIFSSWTTLNVLFSLWFSSLLVKVNFLSVLESLQYSDFYFDLPYSVHLPFRPHFIRFVHFVGMIVGGFTGALLSTIEKRFQFTSKEAGFIAASNDISAILLTTLVSFYGGYGSKPRWLGYGALLTGTVKN